MTNASLSRSGSQVLEYLRKEPKLYDLLAASPLIAWYIFSLTYQWGDFSRDISALHSMRLEYLAMLDSVSRILRFIFAAILTVLLVVRRSPIKRPQGLMPRAIAFFGAYVGIAAQILPVQASLSSWMIGPAALVIGGLGFSIYSLLWLGRSISIMPESRKLVTGGPYSIVRHPLYFGEQTAIVGIALQSGSLFVAVILAVQTACQIYRMRYEESILAETFPEYDEYKRQTAFILPGIY